MMYECNKCGNRDEFSESRRVVTHYLRNEKTGDLEVFKVKYGDVTEVVCLQCGSNDVKVE